MPNIDGVKMIAIVSQMAAKTSAMMLTSLARVLYLFSPSVSKEALEMMKAAIATGNNKNPNKESFQPFRTIECFLNLG